MFEYIQSIFRSKVLRSKILYTLGIVFLFRLLAQIPVPGSTPGVLKAIFAQNQAIGFFNALMGGTMESFSIVLMGLAPYINASIIIQLLTVISPKMEALSKEGERGQQKLTQYTRWLTLPLAFLQSYGMILLLNNLGASVPGAGQVFDPQYIVFGMCSVTAGTLLLLWLGDLISEKGIGNGISILIFVGIISGIPAIVAQTFQITSLQSSSVLGVALLVAITLALTVFVIWFTEAARKIPVTYGAHAAKISSDKSALPIRVNQAGMIPIIFAVSLITFPSILAQLMQSSSVPWVAAVAQWVMLYFNPGNPGIWYILGYFVLVIAFSYFYVSIVFQPAQVAENIQKRGGFVPGIRPGKETEKYLAKVSDHLNLWGGLFLAAVAVFPYLFQSFTQSLGAGNIPLLISGAGLIIVVGVILEIVRQINGELIMHDYDKFY